MYSVHAVRRSAAQVVLNRLADLARISASSSGTRSPCGTIARRSPVMVGVFFAFAFILNPFSLVVDIVLPFRLTLVDFFVTM